MVSWPWQALRYAAENRERILRELSEFASIPSMSSDPARVEDIRSAAEWMAHRFRVLEFRRVEVLKTAGHPVVLAEAPAVGKPAGTVMVYGHYDVQPPDPLGDWKTDPFAATQVGDYLHARGVSDMKGQIIACLAATEAALSTGALPVTVKFLIEGEEEIGSPNLGPFLKEHADRLACDLALNCDAGMLGAEIPTIVYGLRGMHQCALAVRGPRRDLHSGGFGGIVHNPIHALSSLIASLHDEDGRVTLPGFYDRVRPISPEEHEEMARLPVGESAYVEEAGVPRLWGEPGFLPTERVSARPALDVVQVRAGSPKSAIPAEAVALVTMRLVPDQVPEELAASLERHVASHAPDTVSWEIRNARGHPPSLTDRGSAGVRALAKALETVWEKPPVYHREGGSINAVGEIQKVLGTDSVLTGFSLPGDNVHGPNERLHLPTWDRGIAALIHFLSNLATA
ncbi:MAG: M20/M25/M40 family metallo-hydrolase [Candidatus Eisenbacteria bacterium]|nr:M20/M25/M40 family metallo-hydrolase [Candidatus Eisenbacteria bacterium]